MGITVNTSPQQITASVGETKIDVSVSGGIGPTGPAGEVGGGYTLPVATASVLGGVKIGSGITIDGSGVISASSGYTLPTATNSVLGGVKIGSGVTITDGVISVSTNYAAASHSHAPGDVTFTATDRLLGRSSTGGGAGQEITCTAAGRAILDDADAAAQRTTLGLGATDSPTFENLTIGSGGLITFNTSGTGVIRWGSSGELGYGIRAIDFEEGTFFGTWTFSGATVTGLSYTSLDDLPTLGTAAAADIGTGSTQVAAGDHTHTQLHDRSHAITSSSDHTATAWRLFYSNGSGVITELTLGSSGQALLSNGASAAPSWGSAGSNSASDLTTGTLAYARMADPTVTSPSQITASQNDYASFARGINRFTTNGAYNLTGMAAGNDGEVRVLCNTGTTAANTLTIKDESSSSTAANRFYVPWNGDCVIPAEGSVVVFYDGTSQRWRVIA